MKISIIFFLLFSFLFTQAQNEKNSADIFYSIIVGVGIGKSPNFEDGRNGIGGMVEFNLKKNQSIASLGYRGTGEFSIWGKGQVHRTMTSLDLSYGRAFEFDKSNISVSVGVGWVGNLEKVPGQSTGGWFGSTNYERLKFYTIGLPISTKLFLYMSKHSGVSIEGYVNINKWNTFYGINLCPTFNNNKFK